MCLFFHPCSLPAANLLSGPGTGYWSGPLATSYLSLSLTANLLGTWRQLQKFCKVPNPPTTHWHCMHDTKEVAKGYIMITYGSEVSPCPWKKKKKSSRQDSIEPQPRARPRMRTHGPKLQKIPTSHPPHRHWHSLVRGDRVGTDMLKPSRTEKFTKGLAWPSVGSASGQGPGS